MPRLDTFTANGRAAVPNMGVDARSFGGQLAEPVSEFGRQMEAVGDKLQRQRDDIEIVDRAAYFDQQLASKYDEILKDDSLRGETVQETVTNRKNALKRFSREHDEGIGETQTRQVMGPDGSVETKEVAPASSTVQLALRKHIINQATNNLIHLQSDTLKEEANRQADDLERTVNQQVDLALLQPGNEGQHLGDMNVMIGRARGNNVLPKEFLDKLDASAHDRFWKQMAISNPDRVKNLIQQTRAGNSGGDPVSMDQASMHQYEALANQAIAGRTAEEERNRRLLEAQFKQEQEVTRQQFVKKWTDNTLTTQEILNSNLPAQGDGSKEHYINLMMARAKELSKDGGQEQESTRQSFVEKAAKGTLTKNEILGSNLQAVGQGSKEHFITQLEARQEKLKQKPQQEERFAKDPRLFSSLLSQIRTGDIRSEQDLENKYQSSIQKNRGIDFDDLKELRKEFDEMRTPDGRTLMSSKEKVFNGIKPSIDKSVLDKVDAEGSAAFLEYQQFVTNEVNRYRQAGKDPYRLFDANNTDEYVGRPSVVSRYQRSLKETIQDQVKRFKRPDRGTGSPAVSPEQRRKPGESAEEWLKRTR